MISITLQFATMQEAADALARFTPTTAAAAVQATAAIEKAKVEAPKPAASAVATKSTAPQESGAAATDVTSQPAPTATETTKATEALSYDVVSKAITDKVKSNRDHVVATLAKFGVKKGTELKAEQYSEFLAAL